MPWSAKEKCSYEETLFHYKSEFSLFLAAALTKQRTKSSGTCKEDHQKDKQRRKWQLQLLLRNCVNIKGSTTASGDPLKLYGNIPPRFTYSWEGPPIFHKKKIQQNFFSLRSISLDLLAASSMYLFHFIKKKLIDRYIDARWSIR